MPSKPKTLFQKPVVQPGRLRYVSGSETGSKIACFSRPALAIWLAVLLLAGCRTIDPYDPKLEPPMPEAIQPPREMNKVSLPAYRIEPPDVIQIEMLKLIPKPPYRAEIFDVLQIRAGIASDQPIDNYFIVEAEGTINLGPPYGTVRVAGMTIEEIRSTLNKWLLQWLRDPSASVQLARVSGAQPVTGQYLVGPDGTVNLRQYGVVHIAGKTVVEARIAIQNHLKQYLDSPELSVDVVAYNSKVYYIITQGAGLGDNVRRLPITGNETVLDAISQINGLAQVSSKKIWIARPAPHNFGCQQILPIEWDDITQGAQTATNYQLLPGDRLFVAEDEMITFSNVVAKVTAPIERIAGIASLSATTMRSYQTMGRHYNATRNGL